MFIPKTIHQTWQSERIPEKWLKYQTRVKNIYKDWEYILWTDQEMKIFVEKYFTDFYHIWDSLPKMIMKVDVFRYLIMYKMGGLYLDLDYEMIRPYNFSNKKIVLPMERSISYGDRVDVIGNCVFASIPNHIFWKDVIETLKNNPPKVNSYLDVGYATGPTFLTYIFNQNKSNYTDITVPERINFHHVPPHNKKDYKELVDNAEVFGIHHGWGSWKERFTKVYIKRKIKKIIRSISPKKYYN